MMVKLIHFKNEGISTENKVSKLNFNSFWISLSNLTRNAMIFSKKHRWLKNMDVWLEFRHKRRKR